MAKEVKWKGMGIEEVSKMDVPEFMKYINARARRSLKRGFDKKLMKRIDEMIAQLKAGKYPKPIRTHCRDAIIIPKMLGLKFAVHRGNTFENIEIVPDMLGHYFGEFVFTRKRIMHGKAGIGATRSSTALKSKRV